MILSNRKHLLGFGHLGVVQGTTFGCAVSTASEGFLKGYSSAFFAFEGKWSSPIKTNKQLVAKALLNPGSSRKQCAGIHATFLAYLDELDANGVDLRTALDQVLAQAKEGGAVVDFINEAPVDIAGARSGAGPESMNDDQKIDFAETIAGLLRAQLILVGDRSMDSQAGGPKPRAIGYLYGFVDAVLRSKGWNMADSEIGIPITFQVIRRLWPGKEREYMDFLADHLSDPVVVAASMQAKHKPGR